MGARGGIEHEASVGVRLVGARAAACVGRDRELADLGARFHACVEQRAAHAIVVVGDAGVGKSRLASEHAARLPAGTTVLSVAGDTFASPLSTIRALLRVAAAIPADPVVASGLGRSRLDAHAARLKLEPCATQLLAELLGLPIRDPLPRVIAARNDWRVMREATQDAIVEWLAAQSAARPLLLVLDDAHACDTASLDCLGRALDACRARPLSIVALTRPPAAELLSRTWPRELVRELPLPPLSRSASEELARAVLGDDATDLARIVERAAGNAFLLEELLRSHALRLDAPWPESAAAAAHAFVERLPPDLREVASAVAVLGVRAPLSAVRCVAVGDSPNDAPPSTSPNLDAIVERSVAAELFTVSRGCSGSVPEVRFRHGLLREAAYARADDDGRARAHRRAAEWLAQVGAREPLAIAEHHARAGDPRRALPHRVCAAEDAVVGGDLRLAREQADLGLRVASDPELRERLLSVKAALAETEGRWNDVRTHVREAMQLAEPGSARWFLGASRLGYAGGVLVDSSTIVEQIQAIAPLRPDLPATGPTGFALQNLVVAGFHAGIRELMRTFVERLDAAAAATGGARDPAFDAWRALAHAYCAVAEDDLARTLERAERAVAHADEAGDSHSTRTTRGMLGYFRVDAGDLDGAEAAVEDLGPRDDDIASLLATYVRMRVAVERGDLDRVISLSQELPRGTVPAARARIVLADALVRRGDLDEGERIAAQIAAASETLPSLLGTALPVLARAKLARGDVAQALCVSVRGYAICGRTGYVLDRSGAILARVEALEAAGRIEEARAAREAAIARIERIATRLPPRLRGGFVALPVHARTLAPRGPSVTSEP